MADEMGSATSSSSSLEEEPTQKALAPPGWFLHSDIPTPAPKTPHELLIPRSPPTPQLPQLGGLVAGQLQLATVPPKAPAAPLPAPRFLHPGSIASQKELLLSRVLPGPSSQCQSIPLAASPAGWFLHSEVPRLAPPPLRCSRKGVQFGSWTEGLKRSTS